VFVGEVGLGGELRGVRGLDLRVKEASRLGFDSAYVPRLSRRIDSKGLKIVEAADIEDVLGPCLGE
jgi:DNA repair protein RadA/Sms